MTNGADLVAIRIFFELQSLEVWVLVPDKIVQILVRASKARGIAHRAFRVRLPCVLLATPHKRKTLSVWPEVEAESGTQTESVFGNS